MSRPTKAGALDKDTEIDVEWEKFAQNGCPDWWLMTKYTSAWLSSLRGLPHTFTAQSCSSDTHGRPSAEAGQQAAQQAGDQELQTLGNPAQSANSNAEHQSATTSNTDVAAPVAAASSPVPSIPSPLGQIRMSSGQACSPTDAATHAPIHAPSCTAIKGLFTCQCTAHADRTSGQADESKHV